MRYRSIDISTAQELTLTLISGGKVQVEAQAEDLGDGQSLDEQPLREVSAHFESELITNPPTDVEMFEGRFASAVYPWFSEVPVQILDDRGFWRYLAFRHFWWFIAWRESGPISRGHFMNLVDARTPAEHIPLRLYLRAKSINVNGDVALSGQIPNSTDFWRSHIVRVRVGSAPALARAFAEAKRDEKLLSTPLSTTTLREVAKQVNRTWSNVRLDLYTESEARRFVSSIIALEK